MVILLLLLLTMAVAMWKATAAYILGDYEVKVKLEQT
jgi:hypothetical protein